MSGRGQIYRPHAHFWRKKGGYFVYYILSLNVFLFWLRYGKLSYFKVYISVGVVTWGSSVQKIKECNTRIVKTEKTTIGVNITRYSQIISWLCMQDQAFVGDFSHERLCVLLLCIKWKISQGFVDKAPCSKTVEPWLPNASCELG